jgi:hypothetical protein
MTDFLESVRPMEASPPAEALTDRLVHSLPGPLADALPDVLPDEQPDDVPGEVAAELTVRQLLAELARLEDVVRAAGRLDGQVDQVQADAEVVAAMAREQVIIDELHRRAP